MVFGLAEVPGRVVLRRAEVALQRLVRAAQLGEHGAHLRQRGVLARGVFLQVRQRQQRFEALHMSVPIGLLHFVPDGGDFHVALCAGVGMQPPHEDAVEFFQAALLRLGRLRRSRALRRRGLRLGAAGPEQARLKVREHLVILVVAHAVRIQPHERPQEFLEQGLQFKFVGPPVVIGSVVWFSVVPSGWALRVRRRRPPARFGLGWGRIVLSILHPRIGGAIAPRSAEKHFVLHFMHEQLALVEGRLDFAQAAQHRAKRGRHPPGERSLVFALVALPVRLGLFQLRHLAGAILGGFGAQGRLVQQDDLPFLRALLRAG